MVRIEALRLAILLIGCAAVARPQDPLTPRTVIPLAGVEGRIDHFAADVDDQVLYVSALENHTLERLDVRRSNPLNTVSGLEEPQGVLYVASADRLFVASAGDGTVRVMDGTGDLLTNTQLGSDADNLRYDERRKEVIVGYGDGALGILDLRGKKTGDIKLDGHPESFQLEKDGGRAFVNVPDAKEIEVVDLEKRAVAAKWPVTEATKNFPMALDEAHHRLLIGCRSPARLLAVDTAKGKVVDSLEIVGDTDDLFYDAARARVYVIGGGGFVDVIQQKDADHYQRIAHVATAAGARTGMFVPEWHKLFVAVPHRGPQGAEVRVFEVH